MTHGCAQCCAASLSAERRPVARLLRLHAYLCRDLQGEGKAKNSGAARPAVAARPAAAAVRQSQSLSPLEATEDIGVDTQQLVDIANIKSVQLQSLSSVQEEGDDIKDSDHHEAPSERKPNKGVVNRVLSGRRMRSQYICSACKKLQVMIALHLVALHFGRFRSTVTVSLTVTVAVFAIDLNCTLLHIH